MSATLEGQRIAGRYRVSRPIGRGGMATVYLAVDEQSGQTVAVKVLNETYSADPDGRRRFATEARIAAQLRHPAIARVFAFVDGDPPAIVSEYIDGPTLKEYLREHGPLPITAVSAIVQQIAQALDHAHAAGVIHRDVKPSNVLVEAARSDDLTSRVSVPSASLDERPVVKVIDFGIARAAGGGDVTTRGIVLGSASYLAPEQAAGEPATSASDVYALGVVTYELLAGHPPFRAESVLGLLSRKMREPAPDLRATRPDLSPAVAATVGAALTRNPQQRPASAGAFASRLRLAAGLDRPGAKRGPGVLAPIVPSGTARPGVKSVAGRHNRLASGKPLLAASGVVGLVLLVGGLALGARAAGGSPPPEASPIASPRPASRPIPRLVGLSLADAKRQIAEAGFQVAEIREEPGNLPGVVIDQEPKGGDVFPAGNGINLTLAAPSAGAIGGQPVQPVAAPTEPPRESPTRSAAPAESQPPAPTPKVRSNGGPAPAEAEAAKTDDKKPERSNDDDDDNEKRRNGPRQKDD